MTPVASVIGWPFQNFGMRGLLRSYFWIPPFMQVSFCEERSTQLTVIQDLADLVGS